MIIIGRRLPWGKGIMREMQLVVIQNVFGRCTENVC